MTLQVRLALVVALGFLAAHTAALQPWTVDDAYIAFRYAEHAARGHGLVYNPGEAVEGYTSFLWVALLALGHQAGLSTEGLAKGLGVLLAAAAPVVLASAPRWAPIGPGGTAIAVVVAGTSGAMTVWAAGGLEVPLVALLALLAWVALARADTPKGAAVAGLVAGLGVLGRPDAALVPVVGLGELLLRRRPDLAGAYLLGALAPTVPHEAWRLWTYGWPLPNTFYAKVGGGLDAVGRGARYLGGFVLPGLPVLVGVLALPRWRAPLVWAVLHLGYVVAVGGDGLPAWRFVAPVVPVLALGTGMLFERWHAIAVPLGLWQMLAARLDPEQHEQVVRGNVGRNGREVGLYLRERFGPDTLLATNTAGSVPYFSGLRAIDMLGLCDAHIAHREMPVMGRKKPGHEKADGAYVLSREPDLVLFGGARGRVEPFFVSDRELAALPGFRERYQLETHTLPSGAKLHLYVRR